MDIFNNIMETYGGRQMQHIFKSYLILSLIIKQLLLSLFFSPSDPALKYHQENDIKIHSDIITNSHENKIEDSSTVLLILDLLNPEAEEIIAVPNPH